MVVAVAAAEAVVGGVMLWVGAAERFLGSSGELGAVRDSSRPELHPS